jgi:fructokinase
MKHKIISIVELLWDLLPDKTLLGGAPANLAFRLSELGNESYLVSRLGRDKLGEDALNILKAMGLSTSLIQLDDELPTGTVVVSFDEFKNPDYIITPGVAYDQIELTDTLSSLAGSCHCIAFGTLAQRNEKTRQTIARLIEAAPNAKKFLDINLRKDCYSTESVNTSLQYADILKANHHEASQLSKIFSLETEDIPEICRKLSVHFAINTILVTLEEKGVFLFDTKEGEHYIPGFGIDLEDPLGAGDAFSAGFIDTLLKGKPLREACEKGNLLGASVATKKGATHKISNDDLESILRNSSRVADNTFQNYASLTDH